MGPLLPPVDGQLAGGFAVNELAGAPKLQWELTTRSAGERRFLRIAIDGVGMRLRADAEVNAEGDGTWKIRDGWIDAGVWLAAFAPRLGANAAGVSAAGTIVLSGGGLVRAGWPAGNVRVALHDGSVRQPVQGWSIDGIGLAGEFAIDSRSGAVASAGPFELSLRTITTKRLGARNLLVHAVLDATGSLHVQEAGLEIAGGKMTADPFVLSLSPLATTLTLRLRSVGLQDVAALVPAGLAETRGRVEGWVGLSWSQADGIELGRGELALDDIEPAKVRLAPAPGFLTGRVPEDVGLLPAWTGALARWVRAKNPAYPAIRDIEMGRTALHVERLTVKLEPEGDASGRTAVVEIRARPDVAESVVKEVVFQVNVAGPLAAVLRMGLNRSFSMELK